MATLEPSMTIGLRLSQLSTDSSSSETSGLTASFTPGPRGASVAGPNTLWASSSPLLPSRTSSASTSLMSAPDPSLLSTDSTCSPEYPSLSAKSILDCQSRSLACRAGTPGPRLSSALSSCRVLLWLKLGRSRQGDRHSCRWGLAISGSLLRLPPPPPPPPPPHPPPAAAAPVPSLVITFI